MANAKQNTDDSLQNWRIPWLVIAGFLSGAGGGIGYNEFYPARPDPFTGSMASQLELRLDTKINQALHNDSSCQENMKEIHNRVQLIERRIERIDVEMARLPPAEWKTRVRDIERILWGTNGGRK